MKRILFVILLIIILPTYCYNVSGQNTNYVDDFDWMVKTFELNDAGFPYYFKEKGETTYKEFTHGMREKIRNAKSEQEFLSVMNDWLHYFRRGHIGVFPKRNWEIPEKEKESIRNMYRDEDKIGLTQQDFLNYLEENKDRIDPAEGIWEFGMYRVGMIRSEKENQYDAFIINADSVYWLPQQKKAEFKLKKDGNFGVRLSTLNHSILETNGNWIGTSHGIISLKEGGYWIRRYPHVNFTEKESFFLDVLSGKLMIRKLSDRTVYLRIASFRLEEKEAIDRLLASNDHLIRSAENLIIDIRDATGGSDYSHEGLIPYYYTQPIRQVGLKYRATELNASTYENYAKKYQDIPYRSHFLFIARKMRENIGKYYDPEQDITIVELPEILKNPQKIGIIYNQNNASSDEGLLYMARQSYKVKLFGKPSFGAFDMSNVNIIDFPNGKYVLWCAMSVSKRFPEYKIDNIGIQPDFFMDNSIKEEDWVEFVQEVMEKK